MASQNTNLEHPRFGFTPKYLIDTVLTSTSLVGTSVIRTEGIRYCIGIGLFTLTAGVGTVSLTIEGSNDGVNWYAVGATTALNPFSASGQVIVLNDSSTGLVDCERFAFLRATAAIASGAPTFNLQVILTGIARDSEKFLRTVTVKQSSGLPVAALPVQNSQRFVRPAGTLLVNCQVVASGIVLGTLTSFDAILQGQVDNPTGAVDTWVDIATATITASGSQMMLLGTDRIFSMGAYPNFRFRVEGTGTADATTAAGSIQFLLSLDSSDWTLDNIGSTSSSTTTTSSDIGIQFGAPSAEVANTITVALQVVDSLSVPLAQISPIECLVYDTSGAGDLDLSLNAVFSAVASGTAVAGISTNRVLLQTDATGAATLSILNAAVGTVYVTAVQPRGPIATAQVVALAQEASLTFA